MVNLTLVLGPNMKPLRFRTGNLVFALTVVALLSGCHKYKTCPAHYVVEPAPPALHATGVLFATDREPKSLEHLTFSAERNLAPQRLTYGVKCEHPEEENASCTESSLAFPKAEFFRRVNAADKDVVLFIHGYRYSFDESLQIAARLVQRSKVDALPVAYSWPSQNRLFAYGKDYDVNEWTFEHLTGFLQELVDALPPHHVLHIVAHSMGNRAALQSLARLHLPAERLGQLVMIAPDVDSQTFRELFLRSGPFKNRTMYLSNHDLALGFSRILHSRTPRAGDAKREYVVADGLDTVDASPLSAGVIGHSYYESSQLMFDDIGEVLKGNTASARNLDRCDLQSLKKKKDKTTTDTIEIIYRLPYDKPNRHEIKIGS
ncbi:MAG: alpha/beta fold hydrolase [Acidobacteriia bacterium]|nr:alpha/beta fold hydrolase [Terriglobia bacterium]